MELTHTITIPELVWTVFCVPGFLWAIRLLGKATGDYYSLKARRINGIRDYAAMTTVLHFASMAMIQFMFVLIGGVSMVDVNHSYSKAQWVVATAFILVSFMMDLTILIIERRRTALLQRIAEIENFT